MYGKDGLKTVSISNIQTQEGMYRSQQLQNNVEKLSKLNQH